MYRSHMMGVQDLETRSATQHTSMPCFICVYTHIDLIYIYIYMYRSHMMGVQDSESPGVKQHTSILDVLRAEEGSHICVYM
jgi:hypothetical protein